MYAFQIDKKLLLMKVHFFLAIAGKKTFYLLHTFLYALHKYLLNINIKGYYISKNFYLFYFSIIIKRPLLCIACNFNDIIFYCEVFDKLYL